MKKDLIITISRQYGSGGRRIGEKLANALNIPFYDKAIIDMSAKESGFNPHIIEQHEESLPNSFLYSVAMGGYYTENSLPMQVYQIEYNLIKELAAKGSCVIVGRCASHILSDDFNCLNVFIHAAFELRCQRAIEEYGADPASAKKIVETIDKQRSRHFKHYTDNGWLDSDNYHMTLDSGAFGVDGCVEIIKKALW